MATNGYYFFTDANPQASNASDYIDVQTPAGAYGPVSPATGVTDEYRVTSLHTASFNPTAYAACDAVACVQRIPSTTLVNIILKPLVQPALNFVPIKYIIYKGVLESSLISGPDTAPAANNSLTQAVWDAQAKKNAGAGTNMTAPAEALGVGRTATAGPDFGDAEPIDNLFYQAGMSFQLPVVRGGWSLGQFDKTGFGIEVLVEGLGFRHLLGGARQLESKISVPSLAGGETPAQVFDHWHDKEQVLGYMDPCAFYGSFFRAGVQAKGSGNTPFVNKAGNTLYNDVLFAFANKNTSYLDIRNEHGFSFNYFKNYGEQIQLSHDPANVSPSAADYYASGWPVLTLPAASFPSGNTTKARNVFQIQLPIGDNPQPLLYVSQGYRDINRKRKGFPAELKSSERFYDAFEAPAGGFTKTRDKSGLTSLTFAVPNVTGQADTTPVSSYTRLKYLKQQQGTTAAPTVIQSSNHLDNLFYPLDLRILFKGSSLIKSAVYDEEIYLNARGVPGLNFDFVGKVGIARDPNNTSLYLVPTDVRTQARQASALLALSGETSDYPGTYPNLIASKYEHERVQPTQLSVCATATVPAAEFVYDGDENAQASFNVPDFDKLFVVVVANATIDSWQSKAAAEFDPRFRTYLGVTNLQTDTDAAGAAYASFELVLRGFAPDTSTGGYKVKEVNTDPANAANNLKVYAALGSNQQASLLAQTITIVPQRADYVVVLDKFGMPSVIAYPILEFDIKGPPNYLVDVQVSRDRPALLTGGPGLATAWDKLSPPWVRAKQRAFSSWANGETVTLDASGQATYRMPLLWWQDLARLPLDEFGTANIRYRAVAWPSTGATPTDWSTANGDTAPGILVRSNLLKFELIESGALNLVVNGILQPVDFGYNDDPASAFKFVAVKLTVREAGTTEMYAVVQWKTGSAKNWQQASPPNPPPFFYSHGLDYGLFHWRDYPDPAVDSTDTDPRYPLWPILTQTDDRARIYTDSTGGPVDDPSVMQSFYAMDFNTKLHLNCDLLSVTLNVVKQGPTTIVNNNVVWDFVRGTLSPRQPPIIANLTWKARILQVRNSFTQPFVITHPETYAGPQ